MYVFMRLTILHCSVHSYNVAMYISHNVELANIFFFIIMYFTAEHSMHLLWFLHKCTVKGLLFFVTDVRAGQGTSESLECQVEKDVEIVFHEWNFYPSNPGLPSIPNINIMESARFSIIITLFAVPLSWSMGNKLYLYFCELNIILYIPS